jgi:hypothetical protein
MFRKTLGSRTWLIAVLMFATTYPVIASADREGPIPQGSMTTTPPNIVLILTDDQRADTLRFMPNVQRQLVGNGIAFTNGYVVNPDVARAEHRASPAITRTRRWCTRTIPGDHSVGSPPSTTTRRSGHGSKTAVTTRGCSAST